MTIIFHHAAFSNLTKEDYERYKTLLTFLGTSYKVRAARISSGVASAKRYGIEVEEIGTSTIYKIDGRSIEQVCDSVVTHIIQDRSGRKGTDALGGPLVPPGVVDELYRLVRKSMPYTKTRRK